MSNFIERKAVPKVANVVRRNGSYFMPVAANLAPGVAADAKIKQLQEWQATQDWPSTVDIVYGGAEKLMPVTSMPSSTPASDMITVVRVISTW